MFTVRFINTSYTAVVVVVVGECNDRLPAACQHGGYQDPKDCNKCRCPDGWGGRYCDQVATSVGGKYLPDYFYHNCLISRDPLRAGDTAIGRFVLSRKVGPSYANCLPRYPSLLLLLMFLSQYPLFVILCKSSCWFYLSHIICFFKTKP